MSAPRNWADMITIDQTLSEVDRALIAIRNRMRRGSRDRNSRDPWPFYNVAKALITATVGWHGASTDARLRGSEAYEIALRHALDVLEI